jgi:hypothetical protein
MLNFERKDAPLAGAVVCVTFSCRCRLAIMSSLPADRVDLNYEIRNLIFSHVPNHQYSN